MADFTGMLVQVTLKHPPKTVLHGRVREVIAGQTLTLDDVIFPATGTRWQCWTVQGTAITDLQVLQSGASPVSATPASPSTAPAPNTPVAPQLGPVPSCLPQQVTAEPLASSQQRQPSDFVDPAILSFGKSPARQIPADLPPPPAPLTLPKAAKSLASIVASPAGIPAPLSKQTLDTRQEDTVDLALSGNHGHDPAAMEAGGKKRSRRAPKKKAQGDRPVSSDPPPAIMNSEVSRNGNDMNGTAKRGKGWRQTPLLQPSPQTASPVQKAEALKPTKRQREKEQEARLNGWATEDATDVQDMGDFDFEASNKLFDKKGVFDRLRQDDTTADEDRLVSHNKVPPRPGTYGGKNLHPTENVLSPKLPTIDADSTSDADTELHLANGRSSSKHSVTRVVIAKKQPSRHNSTHVDGKLNGLTASVSSDRGGLSRSLTSLAGRGGKTGPSIATSSPRPDRTRSPQSTISAVTKPPASLSAAAHEPHFVIQRTLTTCPVLLPAALETLEAETTSRYGLTRDVITESAARAIAEVAMGMFDPYSGSRRGSRANTMRGSMTSSMLLDRTAIPVIVVLAGNNALGARALAAARHLLTRRCQVIVTEAQFEPHAARDESVQTQTAILKRMQRGGADIKRGPWRKASNYIKNLTGPPALIIDALLAGATYESLAERPIATAAPLHLPLQPPPQTQPQKEAREMIDWANRSRAPALSLGCPSGVSGLDGSATVVEGEPVAVRPDKVLALGAPMRGLLDAMIGGERWEVCVGDLGLNIALRRDEVVAFGAQWVAQLRFVEEEGEEG